MGDVTPIARGPLTPRERAVLVSLTFANATGFKLADVAGLSQQQLDIALAQLIRRGLIPPGQTPRAGTQTLTVLRGTRAISPKRLPPAA